MGDEYEQLGPSAQFGSTSPPTGGGQVTDSQRGLQKSSEEKPSATGRKSDKKSIEKSGRKRQSRDGSTEHISPRATLASPKAKSKKCSICCCTLCIVIIVIVLLIGTIILLHLLHIIELIPFLSTLLP
ncbi:hypothetical protein DICVIV_08664 [Dictyocaulus viviparus]|uniref:Uncharacterized protein n=1 Tax=Dictyocaulus viviparus TaxID=29172 RepID=A0A0D8XKY6_DICVI|nr:hypothetical protein DICVIV_08664 [Dictyocaulus viviparus]